jgi:hypothetical protein
MVFFRNILRNYSVLIRLLTWEQSEKGGIMAALGEDVESAEASV